MQSNETFDDEIAGSLDVLRVQPARDPRKAELGRRVFLAQAQEMAGAFSPASVSSEPQASHTGWWHAVRNIFLVQRKANSPALSALGALILIFSLLLGCGVTAVAAQQSLPDDALYPVKTWTEQVRVLLANNDQTRLRLALELAARRGDELQRMFRAGDAPREAIAVRMQAEYDLALHLALGGSEEEVTPALERIRSQVREQEQAFLRLGAPEGTPAGVLLESTRQMLRERLQWCEEGIQDPVALRERLRERDRIQMDQSVGQEQPAEGSDPGPQSEPGQNGEGAGPQPEPEKPGYTNGSKPEPDGGESNDPQPGDGTSPGPQPSPAQPGDGSQSGSGSQNDPGSQGGSGSPSGDGQDNGGSGGSGSGGDSGSGGSGGDSGGDAGGGSGGAGDGSGAGDSGSGGGSH